MQDQNDNMTETRGSIEGSVTFWGKFRSILCPCFKAKAESSTSKRDDNTVGLKISQKKDSNNLYGYNFGRNSQVGGNKLTNYRKTSVDGSNFEGKKEGLLDKKHKKSRGQLRETINIELEGHMGRIELIPFNCSVSNYAENQLLSIGMNQSHLLVKIQKIQLNPNLASLKKDLTQSPKRKKDKEPIFNSPEFQKFWNQRYLIFQKFDEGVKLDEGSWSRTPPEQVSQFIASKCTGAKVIFDGFAGVGGTTIKLANVNSCVKLIANDFNEKKISCLLNNAKVYEVQCNIEISEQQFLSVDKKNIDVVFVQPPYGSNEGLSSKCLSIVDFQPTLNKVIMKCLKLSPDVLMLLPPQTSIEALCSCLNKCAIQLKKMKGSCSIKVDKIYFQNQFKYILISFGSLVQKDIKLNDELDYIYSRLKKKGDSLFRHKKVIKKIRQEYGMLQLLNLLKVSEKYAKEKQQKSGVLGKTEDIMDNFYEIIRQKQLISKEKLEKLIEQQTPDSKKRASLITTSMEKSKQKEQNLEAVMEEQKVQENDLHYRQSEQTQSDYSHYSYLSGMDKTGHSHMSRIMRLQSDSFSSVIIKRTLNNSRQKRDISPNGSPVTPTRRNGKNRISQAPERKQVNDNQKKRARDL